MILPNNDLLEVQLGNVTFLALFFTMLVYWIDTAFFTKQTKKDQHLGNQSQEVVARAEPSPLHGERSRTFNGVLSKWPLNLNMALLLTSNLLLASLLLVRWERAGHFPLSNLYESLMFLAWSCTLVHLLLYFFYFRPSANVLGTGQLNIYRRSNRFNLYFEKILGSIITACALAMNAFATYTLPKEMQTAAPLVPALQSNWLMMHVTVMIISYAALIVGSLLSIAFLILTTVSKAPFLHLEPTVLVQEGDHSVKTPNPAVTTGVSALLAPSPSPSPSPKGLGLGQGTSVKISKQLGSFIQNLDNLSYRIIGIGFPFLTIGILSGAVWANEAWGSYWSWDPKETWALLTWLVFAIYLHTRLTKGWQGEKPSIIAAVGFIVVWFCYLGVNLIGEGLHSYGFFN